MKKLLKMSKVFLVIICAVIATASFIGQAGASILEIPMDVEYSNGTEPAGVRPWALATFFDTGLNTVTLTMSAASLTGSEFISVWLFNFDQTLNPDLLSFSAVGSPDAGPINIATGSDDFKAGPSKSYDIKFDFPTSNGGSSNRFTAGETVVYDISYTGAETISVSSFDFESSSHGGQDPYHSAMHVQDIGGGSGWVGNTAIVPEPISSVLLLTGGAVLGFRRYLRPCQIFS